ncbi:glycosyltransferase [Silvanigrella aquatica]|uniref:Glycosyltransferase family 2 protein n=1 Tax=Silvanigrella aquatica TaxID=1915309 RepID=A0A1L4CZ86_9BACT|nr:glycosyltransferase family 2 protein [Silvanigrella aquatica]APJ03262.1 hypothetical protein AXG55_04830 [Silvanigrella aquatica]
MQLSLVIPTYNECQNIPILIERIAKVLEGVEKEVIVVDDNSPDRTWEVARTLSARYPWLRVIRRMTDKGLSSAVLAGFEIAEGEILAVMDADLQHDEQALISFIREMESGADIVVGSRKVKGGGIVDWSPIRKFISGVATLLTKIALPQSVSDPMSGFFAVKKHVYVSNKNQINPRGFKILLEFLARAKHCKIEEVGYVFKGRVHGESKISSSVVFDLIIALYELSIGKVFPTQFIKYGIIGISGLFVATFVIYLCRMFTHLSEAYSIAISIEISILTNFFLNNFWTFRPKRLLGIWNILRGIITFHAICLGGALINQAIALKLLTFGVDVYIANAFGYFIAAIWNYIINVNITWKGRPEHG